jgi:hypothetical protein
MEYRVVLMKDAEKDLDRFVIYLLLDKKICKKLTRIFTILKKN